MKRRTLTLVSLIFVMLISCFGLFACAHKHEFSKQDASAQYLASEATCLEKAKYYYSCECGEKGTETFEYGELAGHEHTVLKSNETEHWYECVCGDKGASEAHKGGTATCTAKAVCEVCNASYGELLAHSYTELKHNETEHWYECVCGDKATAEAHKGGTATCTAKAVCEVCNTAYGSLLPHEYDEQKFSATEHWNECYCGAKDGVEAHKGGEATCTVKAVCEVCEQSYGAFAPHNHTELKYDETSHWLECDCGDKATAEAHNYAIFKEEGGQKWYECACGAKDSRYLIDVDEEVLMSLNSKKLFFNNTVLEGAEIIAITYNGNSIFVGGELDVSAFAINADSPYVLHIETSLNRYSLNNVVAYTEVFEDTAESRELMAKIFSGREEENGILNGSYALVENLNFNHFALDENGNKTYDDENNVLYSKKEAFNCNDGFQRQNGTDDEGKPTYETVYTTFSGVFDGRGYTLNNVLVYAPGNSYYGIFGYYFADGATVKNVAINDVYKFVSKTNVNQESGYHSVLFYAPLGWNDTTATNPTLTLENVYIYRKQTSNQQTSNILYYKGFNGEYTKLNINNVIVVNEFATELDARTSSSFYGWQKTFAEGSNISNLYIVSNGTRGAYNKVGKANVVNYKYYQATRSGEEGAYTFDYNTIEDAINAMKADNNDYSSFVKYWTIVDGIPAWITCTDIAAVEDAEGNPLASIAVSGTYTVKVISNGEEVEEGITTSSESEYITCNGASVVVAGEGVMFSAVINVYYNGKLVGAIDVVVDNRVPVVINEEILLSKANGKLYLNGTSVANAQIVGVTYNGASVYAEGIVDVSNIDVAVNTAFTLDVVTSDNKYTFTNVKMYDGVYAQENKTDLVDLLNDYEGTLTGYYVLAENITFDPASKDDRFIPETDATANVFNATFDGRGYTLNNVSMNKGYGIFGTLPGENAVIKNVAINRIFTAPQGKTSQVATEVGVSYSSVLFGGAKSTSQYAPDVTKNILTMENVYIYRYVSVADRYDYIFGYNEIGTINLTNVYIELDQDMSLGNNNAGKGLGILKSSEVNGSAVKTYFTNGCGYSTYNVKLDGVIQLNSYDDLATRRANLVAKEGVDFSSYPSAYWTVAEGKVPAWNTLPTTFVATADELVAAVAKGGEIALSTNITIDNPLTIVADTVIKGNGRTITYTGSDRAIDVPNTSVDVDLTLINLTVDNSNATFSERVVNYNTNGTLTLDGVTLGGAKVNYAVNLPSYSNDAKVVIKNSKISGVIALNIWGKNVNATINDSTLSSVYGSATTEGGAAIRINNNGETIAENCVITIYNSEIIGTLADGTANVAIHNDVAGTSITSDETTVTGEIVNFNSAAIVEYTPNAYFYSFESLEEAVAQATGDAKATVKLTANVTVETLEVLGNVTIDLNGYELTITNVNGEGLTVTGTGTYNGVAQ